VPAKLRSCSAGAHTWYDLTRHYVQISTYVAYYRHCNRTRPRDDLKRRETALEDLVITGRCTQQNKALLGLARQYVTGWSPGYLKNPVVVTW
jgi:hypothetical protein